ncbi:SDR family NAD(P)-dependent oxidoreductase [Amycolatopsis pithecellobii]|uniref:SDR family NAD(P)-dependent oxidoreductase n=1 Tax=Amycolatopsis pithecellobii TaxID=664692 RepID=A0A6N7Z507_9PSEU|nr:SDR family NAD(P)-dependent oxidoreductase [Amycolatopsis pithecellobii]MTD55671.1 SDR family NAD(P)-dependent oxidoreductase [Amycolatopsis pithecellobii]
MSTIRFDGLTAIVTGAGGNPGLGRAHAMLLARRGAKVVVNDIGVDPEAQAFREAASAEAVAAEIRAAGGDAVADTNSIATEAGAHALIETALRAFGSADILVNNAGTASLAAFDEITSRDIVRHIDVNLLGTMWTCRVVWPHMKQRGFGRIVNTGSGSMSGAALMTAYGATKGGVFSFTRALAVEGAPWGITANVLLPAAHTRLMEAQQLDDSPLLTDARENRPAELVAPLVAYLVHPDTTVNGECLAVRGRHVSRTYLAETPGVELLDLSPETVKGAFDAITDERESRTVTAGFLDVDSWRVRPYHAT